MRPPANGCDDIASACLDAFLVNWPTGQRVNSLRHSQVTGDGHQGIGHSGVGIPAIGFGIPAPEPRLLSPEMSSCFAAVPFAPAVSPYPPTAIR